MSEAPKRIWAEGKPVSGSWSVCKDFDDDVAYIRADLVEAAIKRALEAAAGRAQRRWELRGEYADRLYEMDYQGAKNDARDYEAKADEAEMIAHEIRDFNPAQFIEDSEGMTKKQCPLGEDCDLTIAYMKGAAAARDKTKARIAALEDRLEKLVIGAETVLEEWDRGDEAAFREAIEEMRADVEEAKEGRT